MILIGVRLQRPHIFELAYALNRQNQLPDKRGNDAANL